MKLWIDVVRPAPEGYEFTAKSVNQAKAIIKNALSGPLWWEGEFVGIDTISIDHDAGSYVSNGGDYIKLLDWLEEFYPNYPWQIHIHSMNPVGVENMRRILRRNNWR